MLSFTLNPSKPITTFFHSPFLSSPLPQNSHHKTIKLHRNKPISATIIQSQNPQPPPKLYQPFRPPPSQSPIPPQFRNLDTTARLDVLANRLGLWYEYASLIPPLIQEGFDPSTLEEITGIAGAEQNRLVVGAQVHDSLVQSGLDPEILQFYDNEGAGLLYEIRLLNVTQRAVAARYCIIRTSVCCNNVYIILEFLVLRVHFVIIIKLIRYFWLSRHPYIDRET